MEQATTVTRLGASATDLVVRSCYHVASVQHFRQLLSCKSLQTRELSMGSELR